MEMISIEMIDIQYLHSCGSDYHWFNGTTNKQINPIITS